LSEESIQYAHAVKIDATQLFGRFGDRKIERSSETPDHRFVKTCDSAQAGTASFEADAGALNF